MGMLIFGASLAALGVAVMLVAVFSRFSHNRAQAAAVRVESLRALVDEAGGAEWAAEAFASEAAGAKPLGHATGEPRERVGGAERSKGWGLKVRQADARVPVYIEPQMIAHIESTRMSNTFVVNVPDTADAGAGRISFTRGTSHD